MRGPGKGKTNNPRGRGKGVPNKTTKEAREMFISIMHGEIENVQDALNRIRTKDPFKYIDALAKLFQYTMPKQIDIKSDGEKLTDIKVTYINKIDGDNSEQGTEGPK